MDEGPNLETMKTLEIKGERDRDGPGTRRYAELAAAERGGLFRLGSLGAFARKAQFFQPSRLLPAGSLLRLDGFLGGPLGIFETILPISL